MLAWIAFGTLGLGALVMFALERRAAAARLKARGGREVDVSGLIAFGAKAGEGEITHR
jgi:hypothetical protein